VSTTDPPVGIWKLDVVAALVEPEPRLTKMLAVPELVSTRSRAYVPYEELVEDGTVYSALDPVVTAVLDTT
jgi:hypothetical protein